MSTASISDKLAAFARAEGFSEPPPVLSKLRGSHWKRLRQYLAWRLKLTESEMSAMQDHDLAHFVRTVGTEHLASRVGGCGAKGAQKLYAEAVDL